MTDYTKLRNAMRMMAATSSVVLSLGAGSAFAHIDVSGENDTTGPYSENDNVHIISDNVDVEVNNDAVVTNLAFVDANTGENNTSTNTTVEDISTGDVEVSGWFDNEVNSSAWVDMSDFDSLHVDADFSNDTTGPYSENDNFLSVTRNLDVDVNNSSTFTNIVGIDANTGGNNVSTNTTVGDVSTGDIEVDVNVSNMANAGSSSWDFGSLGETHVSVDGGNTVTGPNSTNNNTTIVDNSVDVDLNNTADIYNELDASVNTGGNNTSENTTVRDVSTGSVWINFSTANQAN